MDSKFDDSFNQISVPHAVSFENNSEEDLIDLDKVLPKKMDYNWLLESNNNSSDLQMLFSELHFSNPFIKSFIKKFYLTGKSKQVLHYLMYWNDRMAISCDNYTFLYDSNSSLNGTKDYPTKRNSLAFNSYINEESFNDGSDSLADSLNSLESMNKDDIRKEREIDHISIVCDRMTQSNITDYNVKFLIPQESQKLPLTKTSSVSQNILSRTYDKEDLEILKKTELSQSVFVPHIGDVNIDRHSEIKFKDNISLPPVSIPKSKQSTLTDNRSLKRLFPTTNIENITKEYCTKSRPNSMYQIDKLSKNKIDRCVKISQQKQLTLNTKLLIKRSENVFETDVLTPMNSSRNPRHLTNNKQSRLKSPMSASLIR